MKVFSVVGARPQFIKVAALHRVIINKKNVFHSILHTGQHYDNELSDIFFRQLSIPEPQFQLNIKDRDDPASVEQMADEISKILAEEKPDFIIVYGDTNSTLAGAIAAKKTGIKLAHVEAGLRSYDNLMPEEFNRVETDKISDLLFCPTKQAVENLFKEGYYDRDCKIILSGDIMLEAINYFVTKVDKTSPYNKIPKADFILCTLHRQGLVQSPEKLREVIKGLNEIHTQTQILFPAHPRIKKAITELGIEIYFTLIEPIGYLDMIGLLTNCNCVITDSGGLQKEAFFCKKMCITIRNNTEWTELVDAGVNFIAGDSSSEKIKATYMKAMNASGNFEGKFYGDGNAAEIIIENIIAALN